MPKREAAKIVAVYGRVSEAESIEKSSIEDQVKEGTSFAKEKWPEYMVKPFRELKTASTISGRPVFLEMLREAKVGRVFAIVVRDQDRLSRDTYEMLALYKALDEMGVEVWLFRNRRRLEKGPSEKAMMTMMATFSTLEREMAAVRTRDRMHSMRKQGDFTGGFIPFGYQVALVNGKKNFVPSDRADAVKKVFQAAAKTRSLAEAFKVSRDSKLWKGKQALRMALSNRVYVGEWHTPEGKWLKDHHEALVSENVFNSAQQLQTLPYKTFAKPDRRIGLLMGRVTCAHCKLPLKHHYTIKAGHRYYYYTHTQRCKKGGVKSLPAEPFEEFVWNKIRELCQAPKVLRAAINEYERRWKGRDSEALRKIEELEKTKRSLRLKKSTIAAYLDSLLSEGKQPSLTINDDLLALEAQEAKVTSEIEDARALAKSNGSVNVDGFLKALRSVLANGSSSLAGKRRVVEALVRQVAIHNDEVVVKLANPEEAGLDDPLQIEGVKLANRKKWLPGKDSNLQPCG